MFQNDVHNDVPYDVPDIVKYRKICDREELLFDWAQNSRIFMIRSNPCINKIENCSCRWWKRIWSKKNWWCDNFFWWCCSVIDHGQQSRASFKFRISWSFQIFIEISCRLILVDCPVGVPESKLRAAIAEVTSKPLKILIYSHWHKGLYIYCMTCEENSVVVFKFNRPCWWLWCIHKRYQTKSSTGDCTQRYCFRNDTSISRFTPTK